MNFQPQAKMPKDLLKEKLQRIHKELSSIAVDFEDPINSEDFNVELDDAMMSIEDCIDIVERNSALEDMKSQMRLNF